MLALEKRLREMIAASAGITPEEVTPEYIEEKRKEMYGQGAFVKESIFGGYHVERLKILTRSEIESNHRGAEAFLSRFVS